MQLRITDCAGQQGVCGSFTDALGSARAEAAEGQKCAVRAAPDGKFEHHLSSGRLQGPVMRAHRTVDRGVIAPPPPRGTGDGTEAKTQPHGPGCGRAG